MATIGAYEADHRGRPRSVAEIVTSAGTRIYLLPVETFGGHVNNLYLVDDAERPVLFDVGTMRSDAELDRRLEEARERFGVRTRVGDLAEVVVSHAHVDHYGNAGRFRRERVPITIHELDARVLEGFQERLVLAARDLGVFLLRSGMDRDAAVDLTALYRSGKTLFQDLAPDRRVGDGDVVGPGWKLLHVPGHCPGMVCMAVDDVVLTADQLLSRITPVQSPQSITPHTGLENYLRSLERLRRFGSFAVGLGAHEAPIRDVVARIDETRAHHAERLERVRALCREEPRTVAELSLAMFGRQRGYGILLALIEAGAHVEYLHEHGLLAVANLDDAAARFDAPVRYRATEPPERRAD